MEFLFELRCQELPDGKVRPILKSVAGRLFEELMGRGLAPREILTGATCRRLTLCCQGLPQAEPDREVQELGPPLSEAYADGEATEALRGFAERVEVDASDLQEIKTERGTYLGIVQQTLGRPVAEVLVELMPRLLHEMRWARRRQWRSDRRWQRPVTGLLAVLDGELLAFDFDGCTTSTETVGHGRRLPQSLEIASYAEYRQFLDAQGIEVSWSTRRRKLEAAMSERAQELGGELDVDDELIHRLTDRVEIPGVVHGSYDAEFLSLPDEVLLATLQDQQRALAVRNRKTLLPFFVTAMDRIDDPQQRVQRGHERTVAGRLKDAGFYYEADRRLTLVERGEQLEQIVFHQGLGSLADKSRRVGALVELIAKELDWSDAIEPAQQAAALAKADLTTDMVREYPSLRGTMGGIYAREEGYVSAVWQAVAEHYRPASPRDPVPQGQGACLLAVADRLDTVVGFCGLEQLPKGKNDPFAMRRLVQGLLRTLVERDMDLDLDLVAARAVLLYGELLPTGAESILAALQSFLEDRVRHFLGQLGMAIDEIEATMAVGSKRLPDVVARIRALQKVRGEADFRSLVLAAKRISKISQEAAEYEMQEDLLVEPAELALHAALADLRPRVIKALSEKRYEDGILAMGELVTPLDQFFAQVLVMDENESLRQNRIALLQSCRRLFWRVSRLDEMRLDEAAAERGDD